MKVGEEEGQEDSIRAEEINLQSQRVQRLILDGEGNGGRGEAPQSSLTSCLRNRSPSRAWEPEEIWVFKKHLLALKRRRKRRRSTRPGVGSKELKEYA